MAPRAAALALALAAGAAHAHPQGSGSKPARAESQGSAQSAPARDDLAEALARAVDLPSPAERAKAAAALAARKDASIEEWLAAARDFGRFETAAPGVRREEVPLWNGEAVVPFEVFTYVPRGLDPAKPAPLLLAFHGSDGRGDEVHPWWHATADSLGMIVVAPSEPGAKAGYTFTPKERQAALSALRWARRRFDVDESRIFASGFSRGGHLVWDLALRQPDLFAAIAPMIGGPWAVVAGDRNNLRYLETLRDLPIRDLQGAKDDARLVADLRYAFRRLAAWNAKDAKLVEFPALGHAFEFEAVDWVAFLRAAVRSPRPQRALAMTAACPPAGHAAGRAFFAEILATASSVAEDPKLQIPKSKWDSLDDDGRRHWMSEEAEKRTARLEVSVAAPGQFSARSSGVARFRILLDDAMLPPKGPLVVNHNGKTARPLPKRDAAVLLADFVERFDRTFLPVAQARVE